MVVTVMAVIVEAAVMMMETSVMMMVMAADVTTSVRHRGNLYSWIQIVVVAIKQ